MDEAGHVFIADFGSAIIVIDNDSTLDHSATRGITTRWAAPEIINDGRFSKHGDIFAFAMVMIEVRPRRSTTSRVLAYSHLT